MSGPASLRVRRPGRRSDERRGAKTLGGESRAFALAIARDRERVRLARLRRSPEAHEEIAPEEEPVASLVAIGVRSRRTAERLRRRPVTDGGGHACPDEECV